jgi:hypothetical protein
VGKGRLKERCGLESQTNFPFKKSPKTECGFDSRIYGGYIYICIYIYQSVPCVSNRRIEVNGLYSRSVLSGFNITVHRQQ